MQVVLDTNIWVSGLLLPKSKAGKVLWSWYESHYDIIISEPILEELKRVLNYPKIQKRLRWDNTKIDQYLDFLRFFNYMVDIEPCIVEVEKDPKDSPILGTLIASPADYLVTGDADLLDLKEQYPIITLTDFYKKVI